MMLDHNIAKSVFLLITLLSISSTSSARSRYYDFEIIVFESQDLEARKTELWKTTVQLETPEKFVTLGSPNTGILPSNYSPTSSFRILPRSGFRLAKVAELLTANNQHRVLLHTSWRQPSLSSRIALPIKIRHGLLINSIEPTPVPGALATDPDAPAVNLPVPNPQVTQSKAILEGYIKIILSKYLHAEIDLAYTTGLPLTQAETTLVSDAKGNLIKSKPIVYHVHHKRKMRSREIHYLDHPVVGIMLLATPYYGRTLKPR